MHNTCNAMLRWQLMRLRYSSKCNKSLRTKLPDLMLYSMYDSQINDLHISHCLHHAVGVYGPRFSLDVDQPGHAQKRTCKGLVDVAVFMPYPMLDIYFKLLYFSSTHIASITTQSGSRRFRRKYGTMSYVIGRLSIMGASKNLLQWDTNHWSSIIVDSCEGREKHGTGPRCAMPGKQP